MSAPTIPEIIAHLKTTPAYKRLVEEDNARVIDGVRKTNPLMQALERSRKR